MILGEIALGSDGVPPGSTVLNRSALADGALNSLVSGKPLRFFAGIRSPELGGTFSCAAGRKRAS